MATLRITYSKSAIGYTERQKATVKALGFKRLYETIEREDTPAIRGMINRISHLVTVEEVETAKKPRSAKKGE
jgi:large subunit ribosomal protein L30